MSIIPLPISLNRQHEIRAALDASERALEELLRQAVTALQAAGMRTLGAAALSHHRAVSQSYLHAVEIMLDEPGLQTILSDAIDDGILDIPALCGIARRGGTPGPGAA